jgi:hypothetical protein
MQDEPTGPAGEPGLDFHQWESERASIEEDLADDPAAGLGRLVEIAHRMLLAHGYDVDDEVARQGEERELVDTYLSAHETAERAEVGNASRGEVEVALDDVGAVLDALGPTSTR